MWFIGVEVEQETSAPPPKKNPGSAPVRLLTRCKILDVVSFLHCLQIILSLKSPIPTLYNVKNVIWISTVNRFVDYKFIV